MNWTGGQLRRHSAHKGVLSKIQRHNFAKSRQLANDRSSRKPVSFPCFLSRRDEFGLDDLTEVQEGEKKQEESSPILNTITHRKIHECSFLQDPDWANLSVSRPLEIKFASPEELERFGKRRKLNDADHQRLSTAINRPALGRFNSRIRAQQRSSKQDMHTLPLDQIQIQIDGQPARPHLHSNVSPEITRSNRSSQSMLLSHGAPYAPHLNVPTHQQISPNGPCREFGGLRSNLDTPVRASRAPSTIPETIIPQDGKFWTPRRIPVPNRHTFNEDSHHTISSQCGGQTITPPTLPKSALPTQFAINNQVLAGRRELGRDSSVDKQSNSRSPSLVSTLLAFPVDATRLSSSQNASNWLPEPRIIGTRITNYPFSGVDTNDFSNGVRVFGQLVRLGTEVSAVSK